MAAFRFSRRAEADLLSIGAIPFGLGVRTRPSDTSTILRRAARCSPTILFQGRACDGVRPGLRRMERGRHVVFYRQEAGGILVSRILHQRMLPERRAIDEEDAEPAGGPLV